MPDSPAENRRNRGNGNATRLRDCKISPEKALVQCKQLNPFKLVATSDDLHLAKMDLLLLILHIILRTLVTKKLLGAKGIATRNKRTLLGARHF